MNIGKLAAAIMISLSLAACASKPQPIDYTNFYESNPRSILIVPVVNHSNETEAADLFLTTLAVPLAERGYYVFPTNFTKALIENDGLSDPHLVHSSQTQIIAELFGTDSVLYLEILDWSSKYSVIASSVVVKFLYTLKDGKTGALLWQNEQETEVQTSGGSGSIVADLVGAAVAAAVNNLQSDYTNVAIQANAVALFAEGTGIPFGPYSVQGDANRQSFPASGAGRITNATTEAISYPVSPTSINSQSSDD